MRSGCWFLFFNLHSGGWSPNCVHSARRPIVPAPGDCEDGEFGGMNGRGNRSTRRKPALGPLCPPQIPLDQTRDWTRAAAVGSQRLTASAMARPGLLVSPNLKTWLFRWQRPVHSRVTHLGWFLFISNSCLILLEHSPRRKLVFVCVCFESHYGFPVFSCALWSSSAVPESVLGNPYLDAACCFMYYDNQIPILLVNGSVIAPDYVDPITVSIEFCSVQPGSQRMVGIPKPV
jgi:hypothetical protein